MTHEADPQAWARLRFAIVGSLLAAPPERGELKQAFAELSARYWTHPINGTHIRFGVSTIEAWYYQARGSNDPVGALRRQRRVDAGQSRSLDVALIQKITAQYHRYPQWSMQLHYDNLRALLEDEPALSQLPSYATVRRYFKANGLHRQRRVRRAGQRKAIERREQRETRSYEAEYVGGLWHLDFHHGSVRVLVPQGAWVTPKLLCVMDDHSRLVCHLQWYIEETAQVLVHGLCQALQKRSLPRALMSDNGAAMQAAEFTEGLHALSIQHEYTLPYSPQQNGKQEHFFATLEGRLMAMLEAVPQLTLSRLNQISQVWVESDYNQRVHREISTTPLSRYLNAKDVGRDCPDSACLRQAFQQRSVRRQRRTDGTISVEGKRYELPSRYRHLERATLRYARWDLSRVELIDPHTHTVLCALYPLDKQHNATGVRRTVENTQEAHVIPSTSDSQQLPPLLEKLMREFSATGLPPGHLVYDSEQSSS